jgi:hypothetical protein
MTYAFLHIGDEGTKIMVRKKKKGRERITTKKMDASRDLVGNVLSS